jgi:hypothetical protein
MVEASMEFLSIPSYAVIGALAGAAWICWRLLAAGSLFDPADEVLLED